RIRHALLSLPIVLSQSPLTAADMQPRIALSANAPLVSVSPQPAGRHFVDLPALEFSFDIDAQCNDDWVAESLFLNVADTRLAFNAEQLAGNQHDRIVLRVSERQLAPIAVHDFCATESAGASAGSVSAAGNAPTDASLAFETQELTISAALSAHASLRCANDSEQRVTYVSQPLDLTLACGHTDLSGAAD
ncbi:MAG TPA: hypothetical protein VF389_06115, partial [Woeseiaceae bacterium]